MPKGGNMPHDATLTVEPSHEPGWVTYRITKKQGGVPRDPFWVIEHRCYAAGELVYSDAKGIWWKDGKNGDMSFWGASDFSADSCVAWVHANGSEDHLTNDLEYSLPLA